MKQSFTLTELYAHRGCYSKEMVNYCVRGLDIVTMDFILSHSDMKLTEKVWFISNHTDMLPHERAEIAEQCAHIAVNMYGTDIKNNPPVITGLIRTAITFDGVIQNSMNIASNKTRQYAYAIFAACSRDPYDRIYSAARAIELAGGEWVDTLIDYLKSVCIK